jgi:hypothetical protein
LRAFGPRRLLRQSHTDRLDTEGGGAGAPPLRRAAGAEMVLAGSVAATPTRVAWS